MSGTGEAYDGIVLGTGHNSLVLQAYLCRAGLKVLALDRQLVAGGGLRTEEHPRGSGFLHNTHSFYHRGLTRLPWYRDLELERHGARYLEPELNVALLLRDGRSLEWWIDFDKTAASFARFSRRDADTLRRWGDRFEPIVEQILVPESQSPPLPPGKRRRLLQQSPAGRLLLETSRLSPWEFVLQEFQHPVVQAGLLFFNGLREVDLRCRGFGHHIPALLASPGKAQMCVGGSARLAEALLASVREAGGEVLLETIPRRLRVEQGRVVGVETACGRFLRARCFVASGLNPQQTFLELLEPHLLPAGWREKARNFRYNLVAPLFGLYLNLAGPPRYRVALDAPHLEEAFMVILGLEQPDQFLEMVRHHEAGTIPAPVMWGSCPTRFDPSQAPPGKHTAFLWEKAPYRLQGDPARWDADREAHGRRMLEAWEEFAPGLALSVLEYMSRSPLDVERTLPNMAQGDLLVGAFSHGQVGYQRPFPGAGHYRTCLPGLYLCGSCCHPGGNITGLPGYNCAQVIAADLNLAVEWAPEPLEARLQRLPRGHP